MEVDKIISELRFKAVRSSGPGGQHVNKTASKVEVYFNVWDSSGLSETEKERLQNKLGSQLTQDGELILRCSESRSQHKNKALVIDRLLALLKSNIKKPRPRKKTRPGKAAVEKRLQAKKEKAMKKKNRRPPKIE